MTPAAQRLLDDLAELRDLHAEVLRSTDLDGEMTTGARMSAIAIRSDARARMESYATALRMVERALPGIEDAAVVAAVMAGVR